MGRGSQFGHARPAHPAWISRVRARTRESRGAAIFEAAIVTPVFFILVFGIVEVGLVMNDSLALSSAVRAGSRAASASGNDTYADYNTVTRVLRESSALDESDIKAIVIYKPAGFGEGPTEGCKGLGEYPGLSAPGVCNVYTPEEWSRPREEWGCVESPPSPDRHWCPTDRKVSLVGTGSEYVGVWMKIKHEWVTKMFGSSMVLTDYSVIRLEPRTVQ